MPAGQSTAERIPAEDAGLARLALRKVAEIDVAYGVGEALARVPLLPWLLNWMMRKTPVGQVATAVEKSHRWPYRWGVKAVMFVMNRLPGGRTTADVASTVATTLYGTTVTVATAVAAAYQVEKAQAARVVREESSLPSLPLSSKLLRIGIAALIGAAVSKLASSYASYGSSTKRG